MNRLFRCGLDVAAGGVGALRYLQARAGRGMTVLMYHRVLPDEICGQCPLSNLAMPASVFDRQMAWLTSQCDVRALGCSVAEADKGSSRNVPLVCITFDDGYGDNAQVAGPILEKYGLRATFFVTTGFVSSGRPLWFDQAALHWGQSPRAILDAAVAAIGDDGRCDGQAIDSLDSWMAFLKRCQTATRLAVLARLNETRPMEYDKTLYAPMTIAQLRSLRASGHEIASHTVTHPILTQLSDDQLRVELQQSRAMLCQWMGEEVGGLCYPNGSHDDRVVAAARAAGYAFACTTIRGLNDHQTDPMRLRRRWVFPSNVTDANRRPSDVAFRAEIMGFHDWCRDLRRAAG